MYALQRLLTAVISQNESARPFYSLIADLEGLPYEEAKRKVSEEVRGFIKKNYEIQKHFGDELNNGSSLDKYLRNQEVVLGLISYTLMRFAKDMNSFHQLIKVMHEI